MNTQDIKVNNQRFISVTMKDDVASLDEVVVVGYGVQKKKLVTGATVQVKGEDIAKLNTVDAWALCRASHRVSTSRKTTASWVRALR